MRTVCSIFIEERVEDISYCFASIDCLVAPRYSFVLPLCHAKFLRRCTPRLSRVNCLSNRLPHRHCLLDSRVHLQQCSQHGRCRITITGHCRFHCLSRRYHARFGSTSLCCTRKPAPTHTHTQVSRGTFSLRSRNLFRSVEQEVNIV